GWCVSRPSSHIQTWFTSSLRRGSSRYATVPRDSTYTLQPFAHPVQTLGDLLRNQTRLWKRKSRFKSAPTGQMSTVFPEYFESSGCPGKVAMSEYVARCTTASCGSWAISSMKRTQHVQMMQH